MEELTEAELVRQALLEQARWEMEAMGQLAPEEAPRTLQLDDPDPYKQRLLAAAAQEAVPPVRASELSARLAQGSEVAAKAAAEIAARLASARAHAHAAHARDQAAQKQSEKTLAGLKARADSAKASALEAVAAHEDAVAEVHQASEEVANARLLADAAAEVSELAKGDVEEASREAAPHSTDPEIWQHELAQLEHDIARSTAATLASKAARQQAESAAARGADELRQLHAKAQRATTLGFDAEDDQMRAVRSRREGLEVTLAKLRDQVRQCEQSQAADRGAGESHQRALATDHARQSEAKRTRTKAKAMESRARAADLASSLAAAKKSCARLKAATNDAVDSPGAVRAQGESYVAELQDHVEQHKTKLAQLASAVEAAKRAADAAQRDVASAKTMARQLADGAAVDHQQAITAHETAHQRSRSVRIQLSGIEQEQAHADAAAVLAKERLQAARERVAKSGVVADEVDRLKAAARAARQDADQAAARVTTAQERLTAAELNESSCRAAAEAAANAAAASRLERATSPEDDMTVQSLRTACIAADQFLKIRESRLEGAEKEIHRLECALQEARQAFAAITARAHSPRTEQAEKTAAQKKKEALRAEKLAELKQRQAKRAADAVLQFLDDAETVTLEIQYNAFYGKYNAQHMLERLTRIGAPEPMARGVSSWLKQGAAEIKGPLRKARAIMGQLQAVESLSVRIAPTPEQIASGTLQAQQAGVDIRGVPSAEELALERELSKDEDRDYSSGTNALLEANLVSDTKHSLMDKAKKARLEQIEADREAADAAAASSAARWGADASAYEDQHSPNLAQEPAEDPTALVDRMSHIQSELDGAKRLAKLAQEEFAAHQVKHVAAHDKLNAAVREKESMMEEEMASARSRVMAADMEVEKAVEEVAAAGHALTVALAQQATCIAAHRLAEEEATAAQAELDSATSTTKEVTEAESALAACTRRLELLHSQGAEISSAIADAAQAEERFANEEEVCLAHRVSAEVVGRSLIDEAQRIVDETGAQLQSAQRAVTSAESALRKAMDDYRAAVAQVEAEASVAMSVAGERKAAVAAQQKVDVLKAFVAMTVVLAEQRSAAADLAEEEYATALELEEKELAALARVSEATAEVVQKHSDRLLLLRDEITATEEKLAECLALDSAGSTRDSDRRELDTIQEAISAAEVNQRELEHRASEAAAHAAAAEQTLLDRKARLQARQTHQEGAALVKAEEKQKRAEEMLNAELARVRIEQERLTAAEAAESSALQNATLRKAEASRTAESALAELAQAREATVLASHDCQLADEAVTRLESALQEAQALARAARANEDEARALAIASPGMRYGASATADDSWADLTLHESKPAGTYGGTTYVHRSDSGGTTLRLSSPPRESSSARKTTISFGPDRYDDEGPPAPKWVPTSTGGNPGDGLVSTHTHAARSARSGGADQFTMDASPLRSASPDLSRRPATRAELHAESLSKANPYSEPRTLHQKGHHLNRAKQSPSRRRPGSNAAYRTAREAEREQTFQRLSSPSRARNAGVPSGSFAHPEDYMGDTHGHTFSEAMARQHSVFKRRPAVPPPATGATVRLHKNEENLYELKDRIYENSQPRYMDAVADSMVHGQQAARDRERRKAAAEAQRVADELAAEQALKIKAQAVAAATLKGKRNLGLKKKTSSRPIWERTEEQLHRRTALLEQKRKKEQNSQEQVESQAKWGADVGRLWACVNVLYRQLKLATALFEQVKYEVRTGQDQSGADSPRREMQLQQAFADICDQNSAELTLSLEQRDGLFGVLNHWRSDDQEEEHQDGDALRSTQQETERDAFYQLCYHHRGLSLSAGQCDQLLELVLAGEQQDLVVTRLTTTFEEGRKWSATINKMAASTHTATQQRWEEWEHKRNARIEGAKRRQEEAAAAELRETPELKNSFAKRALSPVGGRPAVEDANVASDERSQSVTRRKPTRVTKTTKKKPPWEVQGYRGSSAERIRSQTPQRRQRGGTEKQPVAPSPPRVYGVHTQASEEKSAKGAVEAELLRQLQWRERTVPNLSRSFASVTNGDSPDHDSMTGAADADSEGAGSPTLSPASSANSRATRDSRIPPESQLPESVAQLVSKLRSLSYGTTGQDPVKLFRRFDRKNRGGLDQREFGLAVRKGGALTRSQMSDIELRLLFQAVDKDADGFISMGELRDFVWGGEETEAAAVELVESRRHKSAAALPLTVGSSAPSSSIAGAASLQSLRSATPKRRVGSPKPLHERRTVSSRERWLTVEEQQERERVRRKAAAPDLSISKQSFETKFAPAARQRKVEAAAARGSNGRDK